MANSRETEAGAAGAGSGATRPPRIYLAGPLFSLMERRGNRALAEAIQAAWPEVELLLPQDLKPQGKYNDARAFGAIFDSCVEGVASADAVLAWLDGPDADSGTCFEIGYAYARGIPVVGIRTDFRHNQERGLNLMLARACRALVHRPSFDEDFEGLAADVVRALQKAVRARGKERS